MHRLNTVQPGEKVGQGQSRSVSQRQWAGCIMAKECMKF